LESIFSVFSQIVRARVVVVNYGCLRSQGTARRIAANVAKLPELVRKE
jgi:hypothetical protein